MSDTVEPVGLSAALEALRQELESAWAASRDRLVRFRVSDVTLTVQAVARTETSAGGKLRWWVVEGGAEHTRAREATQTLTLTLTPSLHSDTGESGPLDVGAPQPEPGG